MRRTARTPAITVGLVTLALAAASPAGALTVKTPSLPQAPNGYLNCTVVGTGERPIGITVSIMSDAGRNVTEFGTGSRVTTEDGFEAEESAGSFHSERKGYYCKVVVKGARQKNVRVSLIAFDRDGVPIATVDGR